MEPFVGKVWYNPTMSKLCELDIQTGYEEITPTNAQRGSVCKYSFAAETYLAEVLCKQPPSNWLDIGPNKGFGLPALNDPRLQVSAIDIDLHYLAEAKTRNPQVKTAVMDARHLGFPTDTFSVISCFEVIEHVEKSDAPKILNECFRILQPDGYLFLSTPNKGSTGMRRKSPDHKHEYTQQELDDLLKKTGFQIYEQFGAGFITQGNLFHKIYSAARDSYAISFFYNWLLSGKLRNLIRGVVLEKTHAGEIRKPNEDEVPTNWYYICRKPPITALNFSQKLF